MKIIFGPVAVVLILMGCGDSTTSAEQKAGNNSSQIGVVNGNVTVNPRVEDDPVDVKGRWESKPAWDLVANVLDKIHAGPERFCQGQSPCQLNHHPIGEYHLIYGNKEVNLLLIDSIAEGMNCHGCAPYISLFEFEKKKSGWALAQSDIAAFEWGTWGSMDAAHVRAQVIGTNQYGIFFQLGGGMAGELEYVTAVWTKLADNYVKVLNIYTGADNTNALPSIAGTSVWEAKIRIVQGAPGMFDILVDASGKDDGVEIKETTKFSFDGVEYRANSVPPYLGPLDCIRKDYQNSCSHAGR